MAKLIVLDHVSQAVHVHEVEDAKDMIPERDYEDVMVELGYKLSSAEYMVQDKVEIIIH